MNGKWGEGRLASGVGERGGTKGAGEERKGAESELGKKGTGGALRGYRKRAYLVNPINNLNPINPINPINLKDRIVQMPEY